MKVFSRKGFLLFLLMGSFVHLSCGPTSSPPPSSDPLSYEQKPIRFALVADSIATGLFADSSFAQPPYSRTSDYAKLQGALGVLATFKELLRHKTDLFRAAQLIADMNLALGPLTNPFKSLYHRAAYNQGAGSHISKESSIIASKTVPESYYRHIANYTQWATRDLDAIIFALGSNDICNSNQNGDQFEHNYREALRHLTATHPGRRLFIVTPPHIPALAQDEIANAPVFGMQTFQCRDYFEVVACPSYRDVGRFYDFIGRIRKVAQEFSQANVIDLSEEPIYLDDLAGDCFHPSFKGHEHFTYRLEALL